MSVRMKAEISETIKARLVGFGMPTRELLAQRKFFSAGRHAHFNAHKSPNSVAPTVLTLE